METQVSRWGQLSVCSSRARPVGPWVRQRWLQSAVRPPLPDTSHAVPGSSDKLGTWASGLNLSEKLISHKTPTDFIFINNYSFAFVTASSQMIILLVSILNAQTVYPCQGLIVRKLSKVHFPLQVSGEDSLACLQIKLLIAHYCLQL